MEPAFAYQTKGAKFCVSNSHVSLSLISAVVRSPPIEK